MIRSDAKALEARIMKKLQKFLPDDEKQQAVLFRIGTLLSSEMRMNLLRKVYSKPANPRRTRTGRLLKSVSYEIDKNKVTVGSFDVYYAKWIEFGTQNKDRSVRMKARPFVEPALQSKLSKVRQILAEYGAL
jgi:HK97 gp10 family phage protein